MPTTTSDVDDAPTPVFPVPQSPSAALTSSPVSTPTALSASPSSDGEPVCRVALADVLSQVTGVRSDVEKLLERLSPNELKQHHGQLEELRELLETCASSLPGASSDVPTSVPKDYFDLLPPGPLENVMRYVSSRPCSPEWPKYVDPADAEALYLGDNVLCEAFRRRFTKVELQTAVGGTRSAEMYLRTRNWNSGALDVMRKSGQFIKEVTYTGDRENNSAPHMVNWIDKFREHCVNVTHLYLNRVHIYYFAMILEAHDSKLESLVLDSLCSSRNHLFIAARHCKGLKKLCLQPGVSVPEALWESIGPSLEDLEISPLSKGPVPKDVLKSVQTHCRALVRVNVSKDCPHLQLADLLVSYGEQLKFAKGGFGLMPYPQCRRVAESCPNAVFELSNTVKFDVVSALHYRVTNLKLGKPLLEPVPTDFFESFNVLHSLTLTYGDGDAGWFLSSLLRTEKPELTELTISTVQENPLEIMSILSSRTTTLRKFRLWSKDIPIEGLAGVVKANKMLDKLTFKVRNTDGRPVHDLLRICYACEHLKELYVVKLPATSVPPSRNMELVSANAHDIARTADACMPLRKRNTYVQIFNVDYLS